MSRPVQLDRDFVTRLYLRVAPAIKAKFLAEGIAPAEAADLVQEAFLRALRKPPEPIDEIQIENLVWRIALNARTDLLRRKNRWREEAVEAADSEPTWLEGFEQALDEIAREQLAQCVRAGFRRFKADYPDRATALEWALRDGVSTAVVGERLGKQPGNARQYLSETRKKLKQYLLHCLDQLQH